jgi:hypothetical protein
VKDGPGRFAGEGLARYVAGEVSDYPLPDLSALVDGAIDPLVQEVCERAANDYWRWERQVRRTGGCWRPIRLKGRVSKADRDSGELVEVYSTETEPDGQLLVACGTRRASRCKSCAFTYRGDAYQVVVSGLRGGKGVPETVAGHPMVFATFTAPSFGAVHAHREKNGRILPCRPRDRKKTCRHGVALGCSVKHRADDPRVGAPLCPSCFDTEGQVIWNARAAALWARTTTYLRRCLARAAGMTLSEFQATAKLRFAKVTEYQRRGAVHFHAVFRLDAAPPEDQPELVAPPPAGFDVELLVAALEAARAAAVIACPELGALGRAEDAIGWGSELDLRPIASGVGELTAEVVAAYAAKYSVKFSDGLGLPDQAIESDDDIEALAAPGHVKALVREAWVLGWRHELEGLKLRDHAHGLGFGGHFLTKSRRYSTTFGALRRVRQDFARKRHRREAGELDGELAEDWGPPEDDDQVVRLAEWRYLGWGYRTRGEAYLAASVAARAQKERRVAKEELTSWVASSWVA